MKNIWAYVCVRSTAHHGNEFFVCPLYKLKAHVRDVSTTCDALRVAYYKIISLVKKTINKHAQLVTSSPNKHEERDTCVGRRITYKTN